jgi:outer membrane lipoprotein-sorting protein
MLRNLFDRTLVVLFCASLTLSCLAQEKGFAPVADPSEFKTRFKTESSRITSVESSFTQEKTLLALTETIASSGRFWFKRDVGVRLEYMEPFKYLMIIKGDELLVRDNQRESRISMRSSKLFQQVNRVMVDCIQGSILESKDFTAIALEDEGMYRVELTPATKTLREFFELIVLSVDKTDHTAKAIEMREPSGDKSVISVSKKKVK